MSRAGDVIQVSEWEDPPEEGRSADEWPYPTRWVRSQVTGTLADDVRRKLGAPADAQVFITEEVESGGYSEYTQESFHTFRISCDEHEVEFGDWYDEGPFHELLRWLGVDQ